uniref:Uncharacterized protein n=1 Tax=Heterorhabditis bacteriophora TaxID=37862 RepID=A0A1I7WV17_HETBA
MNVISHLHSSSFHLQSSRQVERFVEIFMQTLIKQKGERKQF